VLYVGGLMMDPFVQDLMLVENFKRLSSSAKAQDDERRFIWSESLFLFLLELS